LLLIADFSFGQGSFSFILAADVRGGGRRYLTASTAMNEKLAQELLPQRHRIPISLR